MSSKKDEKNKTRNNWKQIVRPQDYNEKLTKLLNKIQIQNKYSNRITNLNQFNVSKLEHSLRQLQYVKQLRKTDELNQVQMKNLNSDLNKHIKQLKQQLEQTAKVYLDCKKQIKLLNARIIQLEKENYTLNSLILGIKRKQIHDVTSIQIKYRNELLESQIKQYLLNTKWKSNILIDHCRECILNNDFKDFFMKLQGKFQQIKNISKINHSPKMSECPRWQRVKSLHKYQQVQDTMSKRQSVIYEQTETQRSKLLKNKKTARTKTLLPLNYNTLI